MKEKIKELYLKGLSYGEIGKAVGRSYDSVRHQIRSSDYYNPKQQGKSWEKSTMLRNDGSMTIEADNVIISDINDNKRILESINLDPNKWEIVSARFSEWDRNEGEKAYSTKVSVKPKKVQMDFDDWLKKLETLMPLTLPKEYKYDEEECLVVPLYDLHFGNSFIDDYHDSLHKMMSIMEKGYKEIVLILGGDILNEDNYNGQTASGTSIEKTDMTRAWNDCFQFVNTLISHAYQNAKQVRVVYVPGNHNTFSGHTILLALNQIHKENKRVLFDISQEVYKAFMLGNVFVGCTHGHRANVKRYPMLMATMFPKLWGESSIRECFTGHLHNEWSSKDNEGIQIRQMPSRNRPDAWHIEMGFTASHKRFMLVTYTENEIASLIYA